MKLIYQGQGVINGVPARDLEPQDVKKIAEDWQLSVAETEGLLIKRGVYKVEPKAAKIAPATETKTDEKEV